MSDHEITVIAVRVPNTQDPDAARCSCGSTWQAPGRWVELAAGCGWHD